MKLINCLLMLNLVVLSFNSFAKGSDSPQFYKMCLNHKLGDEMCVQNYCSRILKRSYQLDILFNCIDSKTEQEYTGVVKVNSTLIRAWPYNNFKTSGIIKLKGPRDYLLYRSDIIVNVKEMINRAGYTKSFVGKNDVGDEFYQYSRSYDYSGAPGKVFSKKIVLVDFPDLVCK